VGLIRRGRVNATLVARHRPKETPAPHAPARRGATSPEGGRFLIHRARTDHPDFPDAISIIGFTDRDRVDKSTGDRVGVDGARQLTMHHFDSRGVFRALDVSIDNEALRLLRDAPGFSQRFTGTVAEGGDAILGRWQLRQDDVHWNDDLQITYRRA
jgi:hypothetical protein